MAVWVLRVKNLGVLDLGSCFRKPSDETWFLQLGCCFVSCRRLGVGSVAVAQYCVITMSLV